MFVPELGIKNLLHLY